MRLYGMRESGNCYKPRLLLAKLGRPFEHVDMPLTGGTSRPEFLARNPNGMVPLLELDDGRLLAESDAILFYLGEGTRFVPEDPFDRAKALQWMFFEQYSHEPYIAVRRALRVFPHRKADAAPERMALTLQRGTRALKVMDDHLAGADWFAGGAMSIADIALYAYTHDAGAGGFDLAAFPHVTAWLDRVRSDPGHVDMAWLPSR